MKILTVENIPYDLNKMPQTVSDDMAFSVLDNSNQIGRASCRERV